MRDIGKNIKQLRQSKNMTQDELAEKLFVTRQTVSNYETGKSRPDIEMLTRIAETLETDPNSVIYGIPQQVRKDRMILQLCISVVVVVTLWIAFGHLADYAKEIASVTYDQRLSVACRLFAGPLIAFLFGWTAMQALGVFAKLSPLKNPLAKRLRWAVFGTVLGYLLIVVPVIFVFILEFNFGNRLPDALWRAWSSAAFWIAGYIHGMHVNPGIVICGIAGCALWLGTPRKSSNSADQ